MDSIASAVAATTDATVALRRDLHAHPEAAFEEVRTGGIVAERLRALGLDVRDGVGRTGVVAMLDGALPGRSVLARADMDALPLDDEKSAAYRSQREGRAHACGHDGHTAVLLAVAEVLAARRDRLQGRVLFVFQPAEEIVAGAAAMLADGALTGFEPDGVVGLHLSSLYPTGEIRLRAGPSMAATDRFDLVVRGSGGHAAKPHQTVDPVVVAAHVVLALQSLVAREADPVDQAVVSITSVHGGSAYNIIPDEVALKGTLRTFRAETRAALRDRILELADATARAHRASLRSVWTDGSPAVVNDAEVVERLRPVLAEVVGPERVLGMAQQMGGDDMALWLERAPGAYFFVGSRGSDASAYPHHHGRFDLDEAALPIATEALARSVLELLRP